jgi:hypothetical protein
VLALFDSSVYSGGFLPSGKILDPNYINCSGQKNTVIPLEAWIDDGSGVWTPVPGGLCGNPEFDADMRKLAQQAVIQIFSKLALNNMGHRAKRVIARLHWRTRNNASDHNFNSFL